MKLYKCGKEIVIHPTMLKFLGKGFNGKVYIYNNEALKILHKCCNDLSLENCKKLSDIETKRILLPKSYLLDCNGLLRAYTTELINDNNNIQLYQLSKTEFINELCEIEKELKLLSENCVYINDWYTKNFMYDGMFRFVDPGAYSVSKIKKNNYSNMSNHNNIKFRNFIFHDIILLKFYKGNLFDSQMFNYLKYQYNELGCNTISQYVEATMDNNDNLFQYTKKKANFD